MHHTQDPGTIGLTDGTHRANKFSVPKRTTKYNADIWYNRLLHQRSASLDLEVVFKRIKISDDIRPELCTHCHPERCRCPAFTPEMPCSSASSMPTSTNTNSDQVPDLVTSKPLQTLYPPVQSPSDDEADQEVAVICRAPIHYRLKSQVTRRCRYYMYNALDAFEQTSRQKRQRENYPGVQGPPPNY